MDRTQILSTMAELKLFGMKAAYDEIVAAALKRNHDPQRIVAAMLTAEIAEVRASPPSVRGRTERPAPSVTRWAWPSCRSPRTSTSSPSTVGRSTRTWCGTSPAAASSPNSATSC